MVFKIGDKTNVKLTTPELKELAYNSYCEHISQGYPKKAWCFKHPHVSLTWETMEKYIKEEPDVFDSIHKEIAGAESHKRWFGTLKDSAEGKNRKANPATLQIVMRNMFGYDVKSDKPPEVDEALRDNQDKILKQMSDMQKVAAMQVKASSDPSNALELGTSQAL